VEGLPDARCDFRPGRPLLRESERLIACHIEVRPERVALEHHRAAAPVGRNPCDVFRSEKNAALFRCEKSSQAAEQGGFSATAWAEEEKHFAGGNPQIHPVKSGVVAERFREGLDGD
jgi:hypothetical protein